MQGRLLFHEEVKYPHGCSLMYVVRVTRQPEK